MLRIMPLLIVLCLGFAPAPVPKPKPAAKVDGKELLAKLQGEWTVVSLQHFEGGVRSSRGPGVASASTGDSGPTSSPESS